MTIPMEGKQGIKYFFRGPAMIVLSNAPNSADDKVATLWTGLSSSPWLTMPSARHFDASPDGQVVAVVNMGTAQGVPPQVRNNMIKSPAGTYSPTQDGTNLPDPGGTVDVR